MKKVIIITLLVTFLVGEGYAQNSRIAFHVLNPLGMFQKAGAKLEYRQHKLGFLVMGVQYYGTLPKYPGTQGGLEVRYYTQPGAVNENFIYSKAIAGHQHYVAGSGDGFLSRSEVPSGKYYGLGFGAGRHFNLKHFFIDLNTGLKYCVSSVNQKQAFFITGPASYLDLHFNVGVQF